MLRRTSDGRQMGIMGVLTGWCKYEETSILLLKQNKKKKERKEMDHKIQNDPKHGDRKERSDRTKVK